LERRIDNNMKRMINANMEKMMRMMIEQFSQWASSSREPGTFPSQPEANPKGHVPSSSSNPNEPVRKVNAVICLRSGREVDNQVRNHTEPCRFPHQFFQNSSPSSTPETGPSSQSGDQSGGTPDGDPSTQNVLPFSPQLRERSLDGKTLHLLRILLLLSLRNSRHPCLLSLIG